jgi:hypothetical protein
MGNITIMIKENFDEHLKKLDNDLKKLQDELQNKDYKEGDIFYHYRNASAVIKIIRKRELWFASYDYLKREHDDAETDLGFNTIVETLDEYESCKECECFFKNYVKNQFLKLRNSHSIYTLSLCKKNDNEKIWERYADNGNGIALGLKFKPNNKPQSDELWKGFYIIKVSYNTEEFKEIICKFLNPTQEFFHNFHPSGLSSNLEIWRIADILVSHLLVYVPALKKPSFKWEEEYRLVMPGFYMPDGNRAPCELPTEKLRHVGKYSCSHFAQSLEDFELEEICLGYNGSIVKNSKFLLA